MKFFSHKELLGFFWQCRDLNSWPHTCYVDAYLLEPVHQPFFVLNIFEIGS
jgi:hypothetical protein